MICVSERIEERTELTPKQATQSATVGGDENNWSANHAIDKDFATESATHTNNQGGWLKIELEKLFYVGVITVYYRFYYDWYGIKTGCNNSLNEFKACIGNHNNVDVSVYQGNEKQKSCGTLQLNYGLEQSDQTYHFICDVNGDNIILSKTSDSQGVQIVVSEVVIKGAGSWSTEI